MPSQKQIIWPDDQPLCNRAADRLNREISASRIDAREIARRRKIRRRNERLYPLLGCIGVGLYVWVLLTVTFG